MTFLTTSANLFIKEINVMNEKFCQECGTAIARDAITCSQCGARQNSERPVYVEVRQQPSENESKKSRLVALLLFIFLGCFGAHRFYVGKVGTGILMLFFGWFTFGIWHLIDFILIVTGSFKDSTGKRITQWN